MTNQNIKGSFVGLIAVMVSAVLVIVGFGLGFTVNPTFWNTTNVITTGNTWFMASGIVAIIAAVAYVVFFKACPNGLILHLLTLLIGVCAMFALAAMWSNCVVEIAYIYGEGNLEIGNDAAVKGSVILFVASGMLAVGALAAVVANGLGLNKQVKQ